MIDKFLLSIPFKDEYIIANDDYSEGIVNLEEIAKKGVPMASGEINYLPDGTFTVDELKHPFESLPSSYAPMALKIYHRPVNMLPNVQIKCSPAKLLQGHNVFGPDDPAVCAFEMLALLAMSYPNLYDMLDIPFTEIHEIDATFAARMESQVICDQLIQALGNVSHGQTKKREGYATTSYFGAKNSRIKRLKAYAKYHEVEYQLGELRAKNHNGKNDHLIAINSDPALQEYARTMARFEANVRRRLLKRLEIPTNLFKFCEYAKTYRKETGKHLTQHLFEVAFADVFKAFEGVDMTVYDDDKLLNKLKLKYSTVSKSGKVSYTKALAAFRTYRALRSEGWDALKSSMSSTTFYRHIDMLTAAGVSKAWLQNLNSASHNNVVPLVRVIDIDFSNQHPAGYVEPKSQFPFLKLVS